MILNGAIVRKGNGKFGFRAAITSTKTCYLPVHYINYVAFVVQVKNVDCLWTAKENVFPFAGKRVILQLKDEQNCSCVALQLSFLQLSFS